MAVCFLSYSECYRPVMETVRRLLETLEFQVDVFDGPDLGDGRIYYGRVWDVLYEMESILLSIHFPRKTTIRSKRELAYSMPPAR
jgi:hypothetical protein